MMDSPMYRLYRISVMRDVYAEDIADGVDPAKAEARFMSKPGIAEHVCALVDDWRQLESDLASADEQIVALQAELAALKAQPDSSRRENILHLSPKV